MLDAGGWVLNIASMAPTSRRPVASYWGQELHPQLDRGLSYELREGVVPPRLPGVVATEFLQVRPAGHPLPAVADGQPEVARIGVDAMLKGRPSLVPGA